MTERDGQSCVSVGIVVERPEVLQRSTVAERVLILQTITIHISIQVKKRSEETQTLRAG